MATAFSFDSLSRGLSLDRVREINQGLPASALRTLVDGKHITIADLVGIVASRRTLDRRLADGGRLTAEESDRLVRFAQVLALATHIYGSRADAMQWLRAPQFSFDGVPPLEIMRSYSGSDLVINLLQGFRHGMFA